MLLTQIIDVNKSKEESLHFALEVYVLETYIKEVGTKLIKIRITKVKDHSGECELSEFCIKNAEDVSYAFLPN